MSVDSVNRVTVANASAFHMGDTAVIIQMKGAKYDTYSNHLANSSVTAKGAGKYEFVIVDSIVGNKVKFRSDSVLNFDKFDASQSMQLIRVPGLENAKVTTQLSCPDWNSQTGGVLVIFANDTLELAADIDISGKGFRGAATTYNNNKLCSYSPSYWLDNSKIDSAGLKGEGFIDLSLTYPRGLGQAGNGGGGGAGFGSGGGGGGGSPGGSTRGTGGKGGKGAYNCSASGGLGGKNILYPYPNNQVFLGGGGGAGRSEKINEGTSGGNGGGIVIIVANYLKTNGYYIRSNGSDVQGAATNFAGAGGGGGGGAVLIYANSVSHPLNIDLKGGDGGKTNDCTSTGQGGGGGGGLFWHSGTTMTPDNLNFSEGLAGFSIPCDSVRAFQGFLGDSTGNYTPVFNGFLFNFIYGTDTICYGDVPAKIRGSIVKGYDGVPTYSWRKWTRSIGWEIVAGATSSEYAPPALHDTTYYQRIVRAHRLNGKLGSDTLTDYGSIVRFIVKPEIFSNQITSTLDTSMCYGNAPIQIKGLVSSGGDTGFPLTYQWQISSDNVLFSDTTIVTQNFTANNKITRYYRRKVINDICATYTDTVKIIVHPLIGGNVVLSAQTICNGSTPNSLTGNTLSGGAGAGTYSYQWQISQLDSLHYLDTLITTQSLSSKPLTHTTYFQRIVYSGLNNTCKDISNQLKVRVLPKITNNNILSLDTLVCQEVPINAFRASIPQNGDGIYRYQWCIRKLKASWAPILLNGDQFKYQSPSLNDTTYFKRVVFSGLNDCCKDTSDSLLVKVQNKIENNFIAANQEICSGQIPAILYKSSVNALTGGNGKGTYTITWKKRPLGESWSTISGTDSLMVLPALTKTTYYQRKVVSGACKNTSDSVTITVLEPITGNSLTGASEVCNLSYPAAISGALSIGGGKPGVYQYSWQVDSVGIWQSIDGSTETINPPILSRNSSFRRIVTSGTGSNQCCKDTSSAFYISINSLPVAVLNPVDTSLCEGVQLPLNISITEGHTPYEVTLDNGLSQPVLSNLSEGMNQVSFIPIQTGTFIMASVTDSKGCMAQTQTGSAKVRLVVVPKAIVNADTEVCGNIFQLNATRSVGSGHWKTTSPMVYVPSDSSDSPQVTTGQYGNVRFLWTESNEFCRDSASVTIRFDEMPMNIDAGKDTSIEFTFSLPLYASSPNAGEGTWSSLDANLTFGNIHDTTTTVSNLIFGLNKLQWTVINGVCPEVLDSIKIRVIDIGRYTAFTPNNDGKNDYLEFVGIENAMIRKLVVFNRWGTTIYSSDKYLNTWDGTYNGKAIPEDTYFYILTADDKVYKGFFVLKR